MKETEYKYREQVLLTEDHVYFGGMSLTYQLYMSARRACRNFRIRVIKAEEFDEADVGCDLLRAVDYYQCIVNCIVTPCTLVDVLQNLQYA